MISVELARALRDSGLVWKPQPGDAFIIDRVEVDADVFYLSELTIEAHDYPTGTVLGFNGTTEWALDSVALEDTLWLPHEHQLREALGPAFIGLTPGWVVTARIDETEVAFEADAATDAYARALIHLLDSLRVE
jgi:hypothetical protein